MPDDFEINPEEEQQEESNLPEPLRGKSAEEIAAHYENLRKDDAVRLTNAEERAKQANEAYNAMVMSALQAGRTPPTREEVEEQLPDRDEDPDAYIEARIQRDIKRTLQQEVAPIVQQQQQFNEQQLRQNIQIHKERMRNNPSYPGYSELEKEIDEYLAQFPLQQQALANSREEVYYRIKGRHDAAKQIEEQHREATQMATSGRSSLSREEDIRRQEGPRLNRQQEERTKALGFSNEKMALLSGPGYVDIDQWQAQKARDAEASKKRRRA